MRTYASIAKVCVLFSLAAIFTVSAPGRVAATQSAVTHVYFSSGQAVFNPQNQAQSQQQAIKNFMAQGLIEATASFLSPDQMGAQFDKLQKSVLAGPQKYINAYQIYSEKQVGKEFRVIGKVTVSMNILEDDLAKFGLLGTNNTPTAGASSPAPTPAAGASSPAPTPAAKPAAPAAASQPATPATPAPVGTNGQSAQPKAGQAPASPPAATAPSGTGQKGPATASRGIRPTKKEILWTVVEKWDEKWLLPTTGGDTHCIFAHSIAKEMDGYGFSILLPQPGAVEMDNDGNIPPFQALSLAGKLGLKDVVVGKVSYVVNRQSQAVSLNADLRVISPGKDQAGVEIHKTLSMEDLSNQAGAIELARRIAPQVSGLLGGPKVLTDNGAPGSAEFPERLGKLVIHLPSLQYPHWTELEKILRRQFQTMHVDDLQIGPDITAINLDGVDGGYILKMNGMRLPSGVEVRIDSYSTQTGALKISFVSPAKVQAKPK